MSALQISSHLRKKKLINKTLDRKIVEGENLHQISDSRTFILERHGYDICSLKCHTEHESSFNAASTGALKKLTESKSGLKCECKEKECKKAELSSEPVL